MYKSMGDLETRVLGDDLAATKIEKPIYVTSLARSGTTIISEILSHHEVTCYHTYGDFPGVFTPYWKNWIKQRQVIGSGVESERAHRDRIKVNNDSIEAFEEVLWMTFFDGLHHNGLAHTVNYQSKNPFNAYYIDHIKKHLLVKQASRYLAKANYNANRIEYLLELFPDAKFIIPIRHPVNHIASLEKQHQKFLLAGKRNTSIDTQLAASGHFEFGQMRELIDFQTDYDVTHIKTIFDQGEELKGWAAYWLYFYRSILQLKEKSVQLNQAIKIIKYEELCNHSAESIDEILIHCELDHSNSNELKAKYVNHLSSPDYYDIKFSDQQINDIMKSTQPIANVFGYDLNNYN